MELGWLVCVCMRKSTESADIPPHSITTTNYAKISGQNCNISQEICTPREVNILYYSLCITTTIMLRSLGRTVTYS